MSYRFFGLLIDEEVTLSSDDIFHLTKVLRIKATESFEVIANEQIYTCRIDTLKPFRLKIIHKTTLPMNHGPHITLIYALPKGDKLDLVIQKAVELGVNHITLVATKNAVVKFDESKSERKLERFEKIIKSAAMQSKRNQIPTIEGVMAFKDMLTRPFDLKLLAHEKATLPLHVALDPHQKPQSISVLVGPEGGFSEEEVSLAQAAGYQIVSFGRTILRSETAVFYALSLIKNFKETYYENI
ncbi:MAG: RsmE family RNA methyltransferase [Bacilli bacterium]